MATQIVSPAGKGSESIYLLSVAMVIVLVCGTLIFLTTAREEQRRLRGYELDAFTELNARELAVFNTLRTAALEINDMHNEGSGVTLWPTIEQLQEEALPPFALDIASEKSGKYRWQRVVRPQGDIDLAIYIGHPEERGCGTMVLLLSHGHHWQESNSSGAAQNPPFTIWYHPAAVQPLPDIFTAQAFIAAGWKEIRPLSGADELQRIKGDGISVPLL